jgi:peroxiredoxin
VKRGWNWRIWIGFLLAMAAIPGYFVFFARFPITRDVPWASWLMFAVAGWLLWAGVGRAFASSGVYRGKIAGPTLAALSVGAAVFFGYATLYSSRQLPEAVGAPRVGEKAPEFTLADTSGNMVAMSTLLSEPMPGMEGRNPRGVLLVFYRGYWWPFCNSELRGIQKSLSELQRQGVRPVAISVDTPDESAQLCRKAGYTYTFLSDPKAEVIRRYDLLHRGGSTDGKDIARPAEFLVDASGVVRWRNLTEDFRKRATPEDLLKGAQLLH